MNDDILLGIGLIVVLGVGLQWLGRVLRFPSIVLLLAGGLVVGPGLDVVDADAILGSALFPTVSLAVGLLLFVGGLELRLTDLGAAVSQPVLRLVTLGVLITWVAASAAAILLFDQPVKVSVLLGAILVVSGPTVVEPLLRLARPQEPDATILRWESIVIDPVGATLSLFCFGALFVERVALDAIWSEFVVVVLAGVATGLLAAALLVLALRLGTVPDDLEIAVAVMMAVGAYVLAEQVRPEAGLFATTTMGVVLANQKVVDTRRLRIFGEPVVSLLIGSLFIVLASRLDPGAMTEHLPETLLLIAVLVVVVRPAAVFVCTLGTSSLTSRQRAYLACMAPRGIVAASTAAFYSLRLEQVGQPSDVLVPVTFAVIIALSILYGLGAIPAARALGVQRPAPHGLVLVSHEAWAIGLARELVAAGVPVLLVARGRWDLAERQDLTFPVYADLIRDLPESGLLVDARVGIIASEDDETNIFALSVLVEELGRHNVYLLSSAAAARHERHQQDAEAWTRRPFAPGTTLERLRRVTDAPGAVRTVPAGEVEPDELVLVQVGPDGGWSASPRAAPAPSARLVIATSLP